MSDTQRKLAMVWEGLISASMCNFEYCMDEVHRLTATKDEWYYPGLGKELAV